MEIIESRFVCRNSLSYGLNMEIIFDGADRSESLLIQTIGETHDLNGIITRCVYFLCFLRMLSNRIFLKRLL